jgi:hypothetical protein
MLQNSVAHCARSAADETNFDGSRIFQQFFQTNLISGNIKNPRNGTTTTTTTAKPIFKGSKMSGH